MPGGGLPIEKGACVRSLCLFLFLSFSLALLFSPSRSLSCALSRRRVPAHARTHAHTHARTHTYTYTHFHVLHVIVHARVFFCALSLSLYLSCACLFRCSKYHEIRRWAVMVVVRGLPMRVNHLVSGQTEILIQPLAHTHARCARAHTACACYFGRHTEGDGDSYHTAQNYARLAYLVLNGGEWDGEQLLDPAYIAGAVGGYEPSSLRHLCYLT